MSVLNLRHAIARMVLCMGGAASATPDKPNIVVVVADFESVTNRIDTTGKSNEFIRLKSFGVRGLDRALKYSPPQF